MRWRVAYLGRDNPIRLQLSIDGAAANLAAVTRWRLELDDTTAIDSQTEAGAFDTTTGGGILDVYLGDLGTPPAAGDYPAARLISFDAGNPNGVVWTDGLPIRIV